MDTYKAIYLSKHRTPSGTEYSIPMSICTVIAENHSAAVVEIERQLDRPGRSGYLQTWIDHGRIVEHRSH